jgi:UDP-N-acetylglucosamine diphosphorylase/glucosamine-1-phosphate N-acetyltransferase
VYDGEICALILAGGKGTRMKSDLAKVLHSLRERPLLSYVVDSARAVGCEKIVVIVGHQADEVRKAFAGQGLIFAEQMPQLGTGHAVMQARDAFAGYEGTILILCGDVPLLRADTIRELVNHHRVRQAAVTVMTVVLDDPGSYGRVIKNDSGEVLKIVEARDATDEEKQVHEINTGIYCIECPYLFSAGDEIKNDNVQKEYYLTDIIEISRRKGRKVVSFIATDLIEVMGINTPEDLAMAGQYLKK